MEIQTETIRNDIIETQTKLQDHKYRNKYFNFKAPWVFFMQRETRRLTLIEEFEEEFGMEIGTPTIIPYMEENTPIAHFTYNDNYYFEANGYQIYDLERRNGTETITFESNGKVIQSRRMNHEISPYLSFTCQSNIFKPGFYFYLEGDEETPSIEVTLNEKGLTKEYDELTITETANKETKTTVEYQIPNYELEISTELNASMEVELIQITFTPRNKHDDKYVVTATPSDIVFFKIDSYGLKAPLSKEEKIHILTTDYLSLTKNNLIAIYLVRLFEGLQDSLLKDGKLNKDYFDKDILVQILNYINDEMKGYLPEISSPSMNKKVEKLVKKDQKRIDKVLSLSK